MDTVEIQIPSEPSHVIIQRRRKLPIFVLRPHGVVIASVVLSALAWALPGMDIRAGFTIREPVTATGLLVLGSWYGMIILLAALGFRIGRSFPSVLNQHSSLNLSQPAVYRVISVISWLGTASAYFHIQQIIGLGGIGLAISRNTANDLRAALYTDYSLGLNSLRYVAALSGGLALYRIIDGKGPRTIDCLNLAALIGSSAISSRLTLIWAVMIALSIWITAGKFGAKRARWRLLALTSVVLAVLWGLNYSRNAHYYSAHGTDSVVMAGVAEIRAYLGAPFQVSLGVANNIRNALSGVGSQYLVDWETNLTTNSALDELLPDMGLWSFPYMAATALVYGMLAGWLIKLRGTYLFLGYPVVLYAFGELWRVDLFRKGIFYTNMICAIIIPFAVYLFTPQRIRCQTLVTVAPETENPT